MTFRLGLTGSIGMGKSTTSALFSEMGVPVWDADAVVHRLYAKDSAAAVAIARLFPQVMVDGAVARPLLRKLIAQDPTTLDTVETLIRPLIAQDREAFLQAQTAPIVLLDIPLLYETGAQALCDAVVVVSAPADVQKARVMARGQMTEAEFEMILSRQMPDAEKRRRATWVIETTSLEAAKARVAQILAQINGKLADA
jgi:dephospho-CoA kinase